MFVAAATSQTPFEKWGQDEKRWQTIKELAQNPNIKFAKRDRILSEKLPKEEWSTRALNDTRYIMKFMSQYFKKNLQFADGTKGKQKVLMPTGFITASLRKMYGLGAKDRDINNCHHAADACIIATVSQEQIKKFALWHKYRELGARYKTVINVNDDGTTSQVTTREYEEIREQLPPWDNFAKEVILRSGLSHDSSEIENEKDFRDKFRDFSSYDEQFLRHIHPMFISRMPKRTAKGQAHKETIRSPKKTADARRLTRKRLTDCDIKDIENSVLPVSDKVLYEQLKGLWKEKGKNAFKEPIYKNNKKVDKNGCQLSPISTIKVYSTEPSGILINHGTQFVNNGYTVCLNIYRRKDQSGKYKLFCAPVYAHSLHAKAYEILPTPKGRSAEEKAEYDKLRNEERKIFATEESGFEKVFSVYPNDYIRLTYSDHIAEGYYVKYAISSGALSLIGHNSTSKNDSDMIHCSVGPAISIEKLDISVLGDNYRPSKRQE
ncbi:hypothetical protein IKF15_02645 [Candidatus Saccharibacteria bacterium]|nr:hypothetical protein [Candidatus Saccharibacteria bacterium]